MSDIDVHLLCGKYTRSLKVSIDNRCKVVNFEGNYPELKHTIWWKGLFVSDIYILCDRFAVNLRKSNVHKSTSLNTEFYVRNVVNKDCIISENGEVLTKEQIDEIKKMLVMLHSDQQKLTSSELDLSVLKLIYSYVLPSFVFARVDLDWLHWCLKLVGDELQKVDTDLIKDDKHLVKFAAKLREKRAEYRNLTEAQKHNVIISSNDKFLDAIISHLKDDCQSLEEVYNTSRARVQNLKELLKTESLNQVEEEEEKENEIERNLYFEREESHRILEEMVTLKIDIANMDYLRKKDAHASQMRRDIKDASSLPQKYLEIYEYRNGLKNKVTESCLDKLRLKAIAEDIKLAIQEVEMFEESLGRESADNKEDLALLDARNELSSVCWQNCEEKVKSLLKDTKHYLNQVHHRFKGELYLKISSFLSEQSLFQENFLDEGNQDSDSDFISSTNLEESIKEIDIFNPFSDVWAGRIQQLKDRIHEQILEMCELLKSSTLTFENSEIKQIPKIYDNILLSEIMDDMCKLFEVALKTYSKEIYTRISSLSDSDLISNMAFLNNRDRDHISDSILSEKKESIFQASLKKLQHKPKSLPEYNKGAFRNSIEISEKNRRFQEWTASYGSSSTDSVNSAFFSESVSSLYEAADIEYRLFCNEKTRPAAMHEVEPLSNSVTSKEKDEKKQPICLKNVATFLNSFHSSQLSIEKLFLSRTFQGKISCLVRTLKCISYSMRNNENRFVTADDLIGILSILFYSLPKEQIKRLFHELTFINIFMSQDERMSLSGNALIHFLCTIEALFRQSGE